MVKRIGRSLVSTKPPESPGPKPAIVDTVILRYFLLVEQFELLTRVLGAPLMVSQLVYDPEDEGSELAMSEMVRSIYVQTEWSADSKRTVDERQRAAMFTDRLAKIHEHFQRGFISVAEMTDTERSLYGRLASDEHAVDFDLMFPLDNGEAASLSIALERGWVFASDDNDALRVLRKIRRNHPYQRIRKILIEATDLQLIERTDANAIHANMRQAGFWDIDLPFPQKET